jgi:LmbE family N-acetylglucosaminyl deacetylase
MRGCIMSKRLLVIGAHPDDAEFHAGGLMLQWVGAANNLMIVSLTDGSAGHQTLSPEELAKIRRFEALAAAKLLGAEVQVWNTADGELEATLELRKKLIRAIREYAPDLIVTHRPADYHPDHRACAQLVQDACYLLQVPNIVPDVEPMTKIPPVLLAADRFGYPRPFRADWVIDTGAIMAGVVELLHCHASQVYEWLPYTQKLEVPDHNRRAWLRDWYAIKPRAIADKYAADGVEYAEAYEVSEYGGAFNPEALGLAGTTQMKADRSNRQSNKQTQQANSQEQQ